MFFNYFERMVDRMNSKTYIHYGSKYFDISRFDTPKNLPFKNKPSGGFWASPVDAEYGWKQWNEDEHFAECDEDNSFKFRLRNCAKVLYIFTKEDVEKLPVQITSNDCYIVPDFEEIMREYDAIEVNVSEERFGSRRFTVDYHDSVYYLLYGWDCDSILVLNPYVIVPLKS